MPIVYMAFPVEIEVERDGNQTGAGLSVPLRYALFAYRLQSQPPETPKAGLIWMTGKFLCTFGWEISLQSDSVYEPSEDSPN